jgi:hypothetical protein
MEKQMSNEAAAREARGKERLHAARKARFDSNGEVSEAPDLNDAVKERALTATPRDRESSKKK